MAPKKKKKKATETKTNHSKLSVAREALVSASTKRPATVQNPSYTPARTNNPATQAVSPPKDSAAGFYAQQASEAQAALAKKRADQAKAELRAKRKRDNQALFMQELAQTEEGRKNIETLTKLNKRLAHLNERCLQAPRRERKEIKAEIEELDQTIAKLNKSYAQSGYVDVSAPPTPTPTLILPAAATGLGAAPGFTRRRPTASRVVSFTPAGPGAFSTAH